MALPKNPLTPATVPAEELFGTSGELQDRSSKLQDAENYLTELLSKRSEQNLSPTMLAVAGEFFDPGRTGSFGESLGRAAKAYSAGQQQEQKSLEENAMMRYYLAQMGLKSAQERQGQRLMAGVLGQGAPGAAPAPGPAPGPSAPSAPAAGAPSGGMSNITPQLIAQVSLTNPQYGKILQDLYKNDTDRYTMSMNGIVFDKVSKQYLDIPIPGQKQEDFYIPEVGGKVPMTPYQYSSYEKARAAGKGPEYLQTLTGKAAPGALRTTTQMEAGRSYEVGSAEERAKSEAKRTDAFILAGEEAFDAQSTAARIQSLVQKSPEMFGVLNKPGLGSAVLGLVQDGIRVGNTSIQPGDIENALRKANINTTEQDLTNLSIAASDLARLELSFRQMFLKGQGPISNMEGEPVRRLSGSLGDTPQALVLKAKLTQRRAQFNGDAKVAFDEWRDQPGNENKGVDQFKRTPAYTGLRKDYESWLSKTFGTPTVRTSEPKKALATPLTADAIQQEMERRKGAQ